LAAFQVVEQSLVRVGGARANKVGLWGIVAWWTGMLEVAAGITTENEGVNPFPSFTTAFGALTIRKCLALLRGEGITLGLVCPTSLGAGDKAAYYSHRIRRDCLSYFAHYSLCCLLLSCDYHSRAQFTRNR